MRIWLEINGFLVGSILMSLLDKEYVFCPSVTFCWACEKRDGGQKGLGDLSMIGVWDGYDKLEYCPSI